MKETIKTLLQEIDEAKKKTKSLIEKEDNQKKRELHLKFLETLEKFQENVCSFSVLVMLHTIIEDD